MAPGGRVGVLVLHGTLLASAPGGRKSAVIAEEQKRGSESNPIVRRRNEDPG